MASKQELARALTGVIVEQYLAQHGDAQHHDAQRDDAQLASLEGARAS